MTKKFTGLCFGGPMDGHWHAHEAPFFRIVKPDPHAFTIRPLPEEDVPVGLKAEILTYHYRVIFTDETGEKICMWQLADDRRTGLDVIAHLVECYSEYMDLRNS